jgi:flagellin
VVNTGISIAVQETFINSATGSITVSSTLFGANGVIAGKGTTGKSGFDNVKITLGNFTTADVGTTSYIKVSQNVAALTNPNAPAFNFQSGASEGDVIQVGIEATNTSTLRISNVNVAISATGNPSLGAEDVIGQIDNALQRLLNQQAQLGAVVVRLNIDQDADSVAATNLQAAESNIRDLNVGAATTEFTKLQILVQVGTSVLAQSNANAQSVLTLFR